jgi:hypothetical protein
MKSAGSLRRRDSSETPPYESVNDYVSDLTSRLATALQDRYRLDRALGEAGTRVAP